MEILFLIVIFINLFFLINASHDSFINECGPYQGLEDNILMPKKEDCINAVSTDPQKCCYVEGEKNLITRKACVLIENTETERIQLIEDLSEIATKINVDCGDEKEFNSDCGINNKNEKEDCFKDTSGGGECCFVKIKSPRFEGQGCKKFDSISLNTIGEAVVAARTIDAELEVECISYFLKQNLFIFMLFFVIFF